MFLGLALLAFYLCSLCLAFAFTMAHHALVQGIGVCGVAVIAALTLWLLSAAGYLDPWLSIAMTGVIALPSFLVGLGLVLGGLVRITESIQGWKYRLACFAATTPAAACVFAAFAR